MFFFYIFFCRQEKAISKWQTYGVKMLIKFIALVNRVPFCFCVLFYKHSMLLRTCKMENAEKLKKNSNGISLLFVLKLTF